MEILILLIGAGHNLGPSRITTQILERAVKQKRDPFRYRVGSDPESPPQMFPKRTGAMLRTAPGRPHHRFSFFHTQHTLGLLSPLQFPPPRFAPSPRRIDCPNRSNTRLIHGCSPPAIVALCWNQLLKLSSQTIGG